MLVEDWMSKKPLTTRRTTTIAEAQGMLSKNRIRQLPVTERGRLVGIVTDRDLRSAPADAARVEDVMSFDPQTIDVLESVDAAAHLLRSWKINALPVTRGAKLVGILTTTDVLDAFVAFSGVAEPSYRLVVVPAKRSSVESMAEIVRGTHSEVRWIRERRARGTREVQLRVATRDIEGVVTSLEAAGHSVSCTVTSPAQHDVPPPRRRPAKRRTPKRAR
jgi:acetoin utilization protein AcuB